MIPEDQKTITVLPEEMGDLIADSAQIAINDNITNKVHRICHNCLHFPSLSFIKILLQYSNINTLKSTGCSNDCAHNRLYKSYSDEITTAPCTRDDNKV